MRRYIPTLILIFVLLAAGAAAIVLSQGGGLDLNSPRGALILIAGGVLAALLVVVIVGAVFGALMNGLAQALSDERRLKGPAAPATPKIAPAPKPNSTAPVLLGDDRSLTIFYLIVGVGVIGFLLIRWIVSGAPPGYPLNQLPNFSAEFLQLPVGSISVSQGLALIGIAVAALIGAGVVGFVLAAVFAWLSRTTLSQEAAAAAAAKAAAADAPAAAKPKAPAKTPAGATPAVLLGDDRSLTIFYLVVGVGVFAFLLYRWLSANTPLGYFPSLGEAVNLSLLKLPGEAVAGWPSFLPGPGTDLTALQAIFGVIVLVLGGVAVLGVALARGLTVFTATEKKMVDAPPAWPAPQLTALEPRLKAALTAPAQPRRLNGMDQTIIVIFLALLVLVAIWVIPGIFTVTATDSAVEATRVASLWTPTPQPGPTATPGPALDVVVGQLPKGDPAAGKAHTEQRGCVACHIGGADTSVALVGPAWLAARSKDGQGIAQHAEARWKDAAYTGKAKNAAEYLYESITDPNAYVVSGYQPNIMPQTYAAQLPPQELADIIAYLSTLK